MTIQEAAQKAIDIQDACNLSGVAFTFAEVVQVICDESKRRNKGTGWKNTHPIITMFLLKMADLNGHPFHSAYMKAEKECRNIANCSGKGGCIYCSAT